MYRKSERGREREDPKPPLREEAARVGAADTGDIAPKSITTCHYISP